MNNRARNFLVALVLFTMTVPSATARVKVARISFDKLIRISDLIVLAKVDLIEKINGMEIARAKAIQVYKGQPISTPVYFVAGRTWKCDISEAKLGETALLFLSRAKGNKIERELLSLPTVTVDRAPLFTIAHSGRGRMPIRMIDGKAHVTLWTNDIALPKALVTKPGPERKYADFIRSVELDALSNAIHELTNSTSGGKDEKH